jgi:hypothetical protein
MMSRELPNDLLWENEHASDLVMSAMADGEESILSRQIVEHVHSCDACMMRLGSMALETRGVTNAVQSVKPWLPAAVLAPSKKRAPAQPVPFAAIFAALGITAIGAAPTLLALPHRLAEFALTVQHAVPAMSHGGIQVFQQGIGVMAMGVCAVLLLGAGVAVTRLLPRPTVS